MESVKVMLSASTIKNALEVASEAVIFSDRDLEILTDSESVVVNVSEIDIVLFFDTASVDVTKSAADRDAMSVLERMSAVIRESTNERVTPLLEESVTVIVSKIDSNMLFVTESVMVIESVNDLVIPLVVWGVITMLSDNNLVNLIDNESINANESAIALPVTLADNESV
jgi:hypothetical protein